MSCIHVGVKGVRTFDCIKKMDLIQFSMIVRNYNYKIIYLYLIIIYLRYLLYNYIVRFLLFCVNCMCCVCTGCVLFMHRENVFYSYYTGYPTVPKL